MTFRDEFPDFDPTTMPPIPEMWEDNSWHNDACPSFETPNGWTVIVDYARPEDREVSGPRFCVCQDGDDVLQTDDWDAVLKFIGDVR